MRPITAIRTLEEEMCSEAFLTIKAVLNNNRANHPNNDWRLLSSEEHTKHALIHCADYCQHRNLSDLHSALTRLAMASFLQKEEARAIRISDNQTEEDKNAQ